MGHIQYDIIEGRINYLPKPSFHCYYYYFFGSQAVKSIDL